MLVHELLGDIKVMKHAQNNEMMTYNVQMNYCITAHTYTIMAQMDPFVQFINNPLHPPPHTNTYTHTHTHTHTHIYIYIYIYIYIERE